MAKKIIVGLVILPILIIQFFVCSPIILNFIGQAAIVSVDMGDEFRVEVNKMLQPERFIDYLKTYKINPVASNDLSKIYFCVDQKFFLIFDVGPFNNNNDRYTYDSNSNQISTSYLDSEPCSHGG